MQINNNSAYFKPKTTQPNFKGFFKISDPRIKTFIKNGDVCINEFGSEVVDNWQNKFNTELQNAYLVVCPSKPLYIICRKFYDLPVLVWLRQQGVRFSAKELPEIDGMFNKNIEQWENLFTKIPQKLNEKIFLN